MAAAIAENNPTALEAIYTELLTVTDADVEGPDASTLLDPETIQVYEQHTPKRPRQTG
jgi:MinD superfamily P-loop ATPase